jgi:SAM-dependent methyltransferase
MKKISSRPIEQHNLEIQRNREVWARKPCLQENYRRFYRLIAARIDTGRPGLIVELGSGMGNFKAVLPQCVTTDLFPNPWLDRQENAYRLSFPDNSVSHLVLFDVWHHLRYPGTALREFYRVLAPEGRLILLDPAASWTGRFVYGLFHHEPVGLKDKISWLAPPEFSPENVDYYAAQGMATRHFWWREAHDRLDGWRVREVTPLPTFAYFASGGFSDTQIGGRLTQAFLRGVDRVATVCPRAFAGRLLVVLEKEMIRT